MRRSSWDTVAAAKRIRVSLYERVGSSLLALLIFMGAVVLVLLMTWLSNSLSVAQTSVPVTLVEDFEGEGGGDGRASGGTQLEDPNPSNEPSAVETTTAEELDTTADAMASLMVERVAELDDPNLAPPRPKGDYGTGGGSGGGTGPGKGLGHGPGKPGRPRRWEFRFDKEKSLSTYAKQLDYFKIELGILQPGNKVLYLSNLSDKTPKKRIGRAYPDETRYYLTWRSGELQKADIELFEKAHVDPEGHFIMKFLPQGVEQELINQEKARAGNRIKAIHKTIFAVKAEGDGYVFYIVDQFYNQ
jgi:hypothetical protein